MTIEVYTFEDADGTEEMFSTQNPEEARAYAQRYKLKWIANEFEWSDSEVVEDYTSTRDSRGRFRKRADNCRHTA